MTDFARLFITLEAALEFRQFEAAFFIMKIKYIKPLKHRAASIDNIEDVTESTGLYLIRIGAAVEVSFDHDFSEPEKKERKPAKEKISNAGPKRKYERKIK